MDTGSSLLKTICNCSLGHTKIFWEAVFDTELEGKVASSVLGNDLLCCFMIYLPDEIMKKYVLQPNVLVNKSVAAATKANIIMKQSDEVKQSSGNLADMVRMFKVQ